MLNVYVEPGQSCTGPAQMMMGSINICLSGSENLYCLHLKQIHDSCVTIPSHKKTSFCGALVITQNPDLEKMLLLNEQQFYNNYTTILWQMYNNAIATANDYDVELL